MVAQTLFDGTVDAISHLPVPKDEAAPAEAFPDHAVNDAYKQTSRGISMVAQLSLVLDSRAPAPDASPSELTQRANRVLPAGVPRLPSREGDVRMPHRNPTAEEFIAANVRDVLAAEKTLTGIIDHLADAGTKTPEAAQYWKGILRASAKNHPIPEAVGLPQEAGTGRTARNIADAVKKPGQRGTQRPSRGRPGGPTRGPGRGRP
ncbi:hypothetical protein [Nocardiopsis coralliicola]